MKKLLMLLLVSFCVLPHNVLPSMNILKKFGIGVGAVGGVLTGFIQAKRYSNYCKDQAVSQPAEIVNPELHAVFMKTKNDLGIKEDVKLRIVKNKHLSEVPSSQGFYSGYANTVYLGLVDFLPQSQIIHNIVHELEHHRQTYKYPGSSPFSYRKWDSNEQAADAASAGYQNCYDCLREVALAVDHIPYEPEETGNGFFTSPKGYFTSQDYELYAEEAQRNNAQCPAHKAGTAGNLQTPLRDFLPTQD